MRHQSQILTCKNHNFMTYFQSNNRSKHISQAPAEKRVPTDWLTFRYLFSFLIPKKLKTLLLTLTKHCTMLWHTLRTVRQKVINLQLLYKHRRRKKIISLDGFCGRFRKVAPVSLVWSQSSGKSMRNDGVKLIRL